MNKTKIEWADYTWNPVTGCLHGCNYCYARRMAKRFSRGTGEGVNPPAYYIPGAGYIRDTEHNSFIENANIHVVKWPMYDEWIIREGEYNYRYDPFPYGFEPTFHRYRLDEPAKKTKGSKVFVCSMADLFGDWVPNEWIAEVFKACEAAPQHQYLFLTKNPEMYGEINGWNHRYDWSIAKENWWFGITVTCQEDLKRLRHLPYGSANTFISIEPLKGNINLDFYLPKPTTRCKCSYCGHLADYYSLHCRNCGKEGGYSGSFRNHPINWVIVGAQTGPGAIPPRPEWVQNIIDQCKAAEIPIFLKDNLKWPEKIQEYPEGLRA